MQQNPNCDVVVKVTRPKFQDVMIAKYKIENNISRNIIGVNITTAIAWNLIKYSLYITNEGSLGANSSVLDVECGLDDSDILEYSSIVYITDINLNSKIKRHHGALSIFNYAKQSMNSHSKN